MESDTTELSLLAVKEGIVGQQAMALLFAIEDTTVELIKQFSDAARQYSPRLTPSGRIHPSVQHMEAYSRDWQSLVPDKVDVVVLTIHLFSERYYFTYRDTPGIRAAFRLDTDEVKTAYQAKYGRPIDTIYAPEISSRDRWSWRWAAFTRRLESLPPFWMAVFLTLPGAVGLLGMPIAFSGLGLSTSIAVLVIFGLINMLTAAALAEAATRSGTLRFGLGFLGQLADEYLGRPGAILLSVVMGLNSFFILIIFYLAVAGSLADATHLPAWPWMIVLFGVCLYFLYRRSINATVTATLLIVFISTAIVIVIPMLMLPYFNFANLAGMKLPFAGVPLTPATWAVVLGIMLSTYFSHILVAAYSPVVLRRDPSGRALVRGSVTAIGILMLIAIVWMVTIDGTIPAAVLAKTTGTVLSPLGELAGHFVHVLGAVLVVLSIGLATVQVTLVLYYQTSEIIPAGGWGSKLSDRARWGLAIVPAFGVVAISLWVAITGQGSFTAYLGYEGALTLPLMGGIYPVLLLAATRRKGDFVPGGIARWPGSALVLMALFVFFLGSIFVHGIVLWSIPVTQALAIGVGLATVVVTVLIIARGSLRARLVIDLCDDQRPGHEPSLTAVEGGQPLNLPVTLVYQDGREAPGGQAGDIAQFEQLTSVIVKLSASRAASLKIWLHRLTPQGSSVALKGLVTVGARQEAHKISGPLTIPFDGQATQLEIEVFAV